MAYEGEPIHQCLRTPFPWELTAVIVVSGAKWNPCGHTLLNTGGTSGHYFHVAGGAYNFPHYLRGAQYQRYLRENEKRELRRIVVPLSDRVGAQRKLEELTAKKWLWGGIPNNCAAFVEKVLAAGGSKVGLYTNCPSRERWS